jgi:hypothetical protein
MKTILDILKKAGGWHHGLHIHIDNPPYMALVLEAVDESGPCGLPALSVVHYGEQKGDAMRDPEMLFEVSRWGELHPFYWRNDYVGVEQWSRFIEGTNYCFHTELHQQHVAFAKTWDKNLRQQGFADVFDPQQHRRS